MPNWVMNELSCIFQTQEEYNAFKMKAKPEGLFNSFIPMPEVLNGTVSPHLDPQEYIDIVNKKNGTKFLTLEGIATCGSEWDANFAKGLIQNLKALEETGYMEWYKWCVDNWGVKWDASNCKSKELSDFHTIIYTFDSPWGTPEHFVIELSKLYPDATFEMVSGSIENDNHYEFVCDNGKMEITCCYETFREAIEDGKWGGMTEWAELLEESEEI